jgi:hypothetical protein
MDSPKYLVYAELVEDIEALSGYININKHDSDEDKKDCEKIMTAYEAYDIAIKIMTLFYKLNK